MSFQRKARGLVLVFAALALASHGAIARDGGPAKSVKPPTKKTVKAGPTGARKAATGRKNASLSRAATHPRVKPGVVSRTATATAPGALGLKSNVALVIDDKSGQTLLAKNVDDRQPIASITKLMTALVVLESQVPLSKRIEITEADIDLERSSRSRLSVGTELTRAELLHLALMASENRAAHALGRSHPGGIEAFIAAMNAKAAALGMARTRFVDPTGLSGANVSTATDLVRLVEAADKVNLIRRYSTDPHLDVQVLGRDVRFHNTNRLVASDGWDVTVSKTGFLSEAGRCLVMRARVDGRDLTFILLDSWGKLSRIGDANRIRKWLSAARLTARPA
ncbi:MAG: serine hydrolase [Burkholderiales bacterium]|nr:serine hydrolase [Burkholderiales bacterium]